MSYRILVWGASYNPGGIERFLVNYIKHFNHKKIIVDFVNTDRRPLAFSDQMKSWNSKIFQLIVPSKRKHIILYYRKFDSFFKKYSKNYDCMWFNLIDLSNITAVKYAHKYGVPKIIVHSHNSKYMSSLNSIGGIEGYIKHKLNKKLIDNYATDFWSCSPSGTDWMFPNDLKSKVKIINNAIEPKLYMVNVEKRNSIRKKYHLSDDIIVLGNVGRLQLQKNQIFALKVMSELVKMNTKIKLIFVGDGPDKKKLLQKTNELSLKNNVIFVGKQMDMQAWYSTFDYFLLPSLFEGLSVASIEAQANGLPIFASSNIIPKNSIINSNIDLISLSYSPKYWADKILRKINSNFTRENELQIKQNFEVSSFDIDIESQKLQKNFLSSKSR